MAIIGISQGNAPADPSILSNTRAVIGPRTSGWKMSNIRFYNYPSTSVIL